jgi:hypothetical protein
MKNNYGLATLGLLLMSGVSGATGIWPDLVPPKDWKAFWASVHVDPPPPENFLEFDYKGRIDNLTGGRLSDETVRRWVLGDIRRGRGDVYAGMNLREDIVNANVFGPPGLNGTINGIESMRRQGLLRIEAPADPHIVAAAVIAVPKELLGGGDPATRLSEYVIVLVFRSAPGESTLVYRDGRRETRSDKGKGELSWQLDTGFFYESPALGPLWYQSRGWSCRPDTGTPIGLLCAMVKP